MISDQYGSLFSSLNLMVLQLEMRLLLYIVQQFPQSGIGCRETLLSIISGSMFKFYFIHDRRQLSVF